MWAGMKPTASVRCTAYSASYAIKPLMSALGPTADCRHRLPLMRILRYPARPRNWHCNNLHTLHSAFRAAHPWHQLLERGRPAGDPRQRLRGNLAPRLAALASDADEKSAEAIIELLDVREGAHARIVPPVCCGRPCRRGQSRYCIGGLSWASVGQAG
jgi:hypothetical protein